MIDRKNQGKGYSRVALSKVLEEIRAIPGVNRISIRYMPENPVEAVVGQLRLRLREGGWDRDGELITVLKL